MCLFADVPVHFQYVFMLMFEERGGGWHSRGLTLMLLVDYTEHDTHAQHHPEPPPPPPCGVAIIKMIYLTIGPRLRD